MTPADHEFAVMTTEAGRDLLAEIARVKSPGAKEIERWRKRLDRDFVTAALRLAEGRSRGRGKFDRADRMWFSRTGLEQATSERVARHKARRFAGGTVVDLCCGIGGDALALADEATGVIAVDRDPDQLRRTRWNAHVYRSDGRLLAVQSTAEAMPIPGGSRVHVDPDRRARSGPRAKNVEGYVPDRSSLLDLTRRARGGAIKLGPASDFATQFDSPDFEAEVISLDGECKEATVWFGDLATCHRRATILPSGATWTDRDGSGRCRRMPLGEWIFDPDPALARSGLLDPFAAAHSLARFSETIDLLTDSESRDHPMIVPFRVEAILPLDLKIIRREVASRSIGILEIKTRRTEMTPETVRRQLDLGGSASATLFLLGEDRAGRAILARRG